jgi:plasmid stabilization system protein ParE
MEYDLFVGPEAEAELLLARDWYEERRAGLGREFLSSVSEAFDRIQRTPLAFSPSYRDVRQVLARRFPYVVCYTVGGNVINVIAVLHGHRDPNEWKRRVR